MLKDERLYAFIVARSARSRSRIRRIAIHKRWLKISACASFVVLLAALYGCYGLVQRAAHLHVERENSRLREENERQRQQLDKLVDRVEAVEDASRRLKEISGVSGESAEEGGELRGAGGPVVLLDAAAISAVENRAEQLAAELQAVESVLRDRVPSIWPVEGRFTDDFGVRGNPFGRGSAEFHAGQDIAAAWGTPVAAAGGGVVSFAGSQSGYGNIVVVEHGNGLTTRYGHLSRVEAVQGQQVARGDMIGRIGSTGRSTGPHLHYEVRLNETAVNPARYLAPEPAPAPESWE